MLEKINQLEEKLRNIDSQKVIAMVFSIIILVGGYFTTNYFYFSEQDVLILKEKEKLQQLKTSNELLVELSNNYPELEKESTRIDAEYVQLLPLVPEKRELPSVLQSIQSLAYQRQLRLANFEPKPIKTTTSNLAEVVIDTELLGDDESIRQYMTSLNNLDRVIHINALRYTRNETRQGFIENETNNSNETNVQNVSNNANNANKNNDFVKAKINLSVYLINKLADKKVK
ncbi:MAG: type 4a pilus biogenesis protein PilO [Blastocatellia bacterium]